MDDNPYHGEASCFHPGCSRPAYYFQNGFPFCGYHSAKALRTKLPKNPQAAANYAETLAEHRRSYRAAWLKNKGCGRRGKIRLKQISMFRRRGATLRPKYMNVFPNYGMRRAEGGKGYSSMSPKEIGPIHHGQPGLPPSLNLENFHQGSKWFTTQTAEQQRERQIQMFRDPKPHRHNPDAVAGLRSRRRSGGGALHEQTMARCRGFVWYDESGERYVLSYVESRQFYCNFMERSLAENPDFIKLKRRFKSGLNIQICGYDAREDADESKLEEYYLDETKPFGHEMVIWAMLIEDDEDKYPWRIHKTFYF